MRSLLIQARAPTNTILESAPFFNGRARAGRAPTTNTYLLIL